MDSREPVSLPKEWAAKKRLFGLRAGAAALCSFLVLPLLSFVFSFIPSAVWYSVEALFLLKQHRQWSKLSALVPSSCKHAHDQDTHRTHSQAKAWAAQKEVLASFHALDYDPFVWLSQWFKGADIKTLRAENVADLLAVSAWGMGGREQVRALGFAEDLDLMVCELEEYCEHFRSSKSSSGTNRSSTELILSCGNQVSKALHDGSGETADTFSAGTHLQPSHPCAPPSPSSLLPDPQQSPPTTSNTNPTATHPGLGLNPAAANRTGPFRFQQGPCPSPSALQADVSTSFTAQQASTPAPSFYQHTTAPLPHWYRPMLVYGAFEFMAWMNRNMLTWTGFRAHSMGCLEYFTFNLRNGGGSTEEQQPCLGADGRPLAPVLLLHGVGCGLMPYFKLLITLASAGVPVIAIEYKHVGQRWCGHKVPSLLELRDGVLDILERHGVLELGSGGGAHIIAHSFGSAVASTILQAKPGAVASLTLLDPICFHMWIPSLLINFIYRPMNFFHARSDLGLDRRHRQTAPVTITKNNHNDEINSVNTLPASSHPPSPCSNPPQPLNPTSPAAASPLCGPATDSNQQGMSVTCSNVPAAGGSSDVAISGISGSTIYRRGKPWGAGDGKGTLEQLQAGPGQHAGVLSSHHSSHTSSTCGEDISEGEGLHGLMATDSHQATAMTSKPQPRSSQQQNHSCPATGPLLPSSCPAVASVGASEEAFGGVVAKCGGRVHALCQQLRAWLAWAWSWVPVPHVGRLIKELMLLGPAREMHCAASLCRLMDWREASLSAQALGPLALKGKALLALSAEDELLPAPLLASWALNHIPGPPKVHLFPRLRHADILLHGPAQDKLVMDIIQMAYGTLQPRGPSESFSL